MNNEIDKNEQLEIEGAEVKAPSTSNRITVKKKKKRKKKHYTIKFLILVALCVAVYFFLHSSVFDIQKIALEENDYMTVKELQQVTGLKKGMNLFEFNAGDCEETLQRDPYIREADISRKLPDTVQIKLDLREKTAVLEYGEKYVLIDNEGIVLDITKKEPQYTVLAGITVTEATEGQEVQVKEEKKYQQYMELLKEMQDADLYFKRLELQDDQIKAYAMDKLYCVSSVDNFIGGMQDGNLKAVLWDLMEREVEKGVITIGDNQYYSFNKEVSTSKKKTK